MTQARLESNHNMVCERAHIGCDLKGSLQHFGEFL
jgi:hypothetical protein